MGSPVVYCINTHDAPSSKSVWTACWPPTCASVGGSSFATTSAGRHCHHALHRVHLGHRRCFLHDLRYHLRDRRRYHRHAHRLQMAAETPITLSGRVQTSIRTSCERRRLALEVGACEAKHGFFYACAVKAMETLRIVTGWSRASNERQRTATAAAPTATAAAASATAACAHPPRATTKPSTRALPNQPFLLT